MQRPKPTTTAEERAAFFFKKLNLQTSIALAHHWSGNTKHGALGLEKELGEIRALAPGETDRVQEKAS